MRNRIATDTCPIRGRLRRQAVQTAEPLRQSNAHHPPGRAMPAAPIARSRFPARLRRTGRRDSGGHPSPCRLPLPLRRKAFGGTEPASRKIHDGGCFGLFAAGSDMGMSCAWTCWTQFSLVGWGGNPNTAHPGARQRWGQPAAHPNLRRCAGQLRRTMPPGSSVTCAPNASRIKVAASASWFRENRARTMRAPKASLVSTRRPGR